MITNEDMLRYAKEEYRREHMQGLHPSPRPCTTIDPATSIKRWEVSP